LTIHSQTQTPLRRTQPEAHGPSGWSPLCCVLVPDLWPTGAVATSLHAETAARLTTAAASSNRERKRDDRIIERSLYGGAPYVRRYDREHRYGR